MTEEGVVYSVEPEYTHKHELLFMMALSTAFGSSAIDVIFAMFAFVLITFWYVYYFVLELL